MLIDFIFRLVKIWAHVTDRTQLSDLEVVWCKTEVLTYLWSWSVLRVFQFIALTITQFNGKLHY